MLRERRFQQTLQYQQALVPAAIANVIKNE